MKAEELLERHHEEIVGLCRQFHVARLRLFGSSLTTEWDPETSDLDFLVEYKPESRLLPPLDRLVGLQMALTTLLGKDVDVVDWNAARNPIFRETASAAAKEIYAA